MAVLATLVPAAPAAAQGPPCLAAEPPPVSAPSRPLRFGITPQLAGTAGGEQGSVAPEDRVRALDALGRLQPPGRRLVMRLNRLFSADGRAGIERFAALANEYARAGFDVESQVRYHPAPAEEGDIAAFERFARDAAARLGRNRALVSLSITNEVNFPISSNTSDGAFDGALDALVRGTVAARRALDRLGRRDVSLGFSYAWRYLPNSDVDFWRGIGARATPEFRAALGHVGVQLYPGLFWPPVLFPGDTAGDEALEALTIVRDCYMPLAGLDRGVELWVTENGYATNLGRSTERQVTDLTTTVEAVHQYSGTLGATDYRWFNLRDNRSSGSDLFDAVGLLRDDYSEKPAFAAYRALVERHGREPAARRCTIVVRLPRLRPGERYRRARARADQGAVERLALDARRRRLRLVVDEGERVIRLTLRTTRRRTIRLLRFIPACTA